PHLASGNLPTFRSRPSLYAASSPIFILRCYAGREYRGSLVRPSFLAHSAARAACQSGDRRIVELKRLGACSVCLGHISARRPRYREQAAPRDRWRASRGTFALLIRRQTRLSRGVKQILVTGITVTTLLASVATASAQNIFEALFGRLAPSPAPIVPAANFTARDRQQLANPPYRQASIPPAYRRQIVRYHRKEAPGTVLVD